MKNLKPKDFLFFILLALIYIKLIYIPTVNGIFAFAYDQGRDLLEAAKLAFEKDFTLIGPTTGLQGIFYGPWWYYLLSIPVFVSSGNPTFVAIVFSLLSLATSIGLYFLILKLTKSRLLSAFFAYFALASSFWMLSPTNIWSPSIVPISMILFFFSFIKIVETKKVIYFFLYGVASQTILNGEVAFGVMTSLWVVASIFIFRNYLCNKKIIFTLLGALIFWLPQIIFELRNNFLETRAVIAYLENPKIYGEEFAIYIRLVQRLQATFSLFARTFFNQNNLLAFSFISFILICAASVYKKIKKETILINLSKFLIGYIVFSVIFFTLFQDRVWEYYLVGLPVTFVILVAIILNNVIKITVLKNISFMFLAIIFVINMPTALLKKFDPSKLNDGGVYVNADQVMSHLITQKPQDYSLYVYSPAIFDPPFDYLVYWHQRNGRIEAPKEKQNEFYLVIREYESQKYKNSGWYGDKTKDKSNIVYQKKFGGDLVVEKQTFNED